MKEIGPLIALIVFVVLTLICSICAYLNYSEIEGTSPPTTRMESKIEVEAKEVEKYKADIRDVQAKIDSLKVQIRQEQDQGEFLDGLKALYDDAEKTRGKTQGLSQKFATAGTDLGRDIDTKKKKQKEEISAKDADLDNEKTPLIQKATEQKDLAEKLMSKDRKDLEAEENLYKRQKNIEDTQLAEAARQQDALTSRELEHATLLQEIDGDVIKSDPTNNTIIINRGTADGVQNGFRFEVFTMRNSNKKVSKGYIEVRKAEASLSECYILKRVVMLPSDPFSDYTADQPEARYSAKHSGKNGLAQPLSGNGRMVDLGMQPLDPIVEGDHIENPFWKPGKTLTFYIAGDKKIKDGQQRTAIAYSAQQIARVVQSYGGKIVDKVDMGVDYVITQKYFDKATASAQGVDPDPNFERATTLGVPVVFEWELFRFLDQK